VVVTFRILGLEQLVREELDIALDVCCYGAVVEKVLASISDVERERSALKNPDLSFSMIPFGEIPFLYGIAKQPKKWWRPRRYLIS
jgi:hypothetical protein